LENIKKSGILKGKVEAKDKWQDIKFYRPVGCEQCSGGYKGRLGIYEVLEIDDEMEKLISEKASTEEIEKASKEKGMLTMVEDGFIKVIQGITSVEEVLRVTKE
jgi:type II secretory ATPase GspE/PulE/Tfp pilus assembly ATPase PilB-like protein